MASNCFQASPSTEEGPLKPVIIAGQTADSICSSPEIVGQGSMQPLQSASETDDQKKKPESPAVGAQVYVDLHEGKKSDLFNISTGCLDPGEEASDPHRGNTPPVTVHAETLVSPKEEAPLELGTLDSYKGEATVTSGTSESHKEATHVNVEALGSPKGEKPVDPKLSNAKTLNQVDSLTKTLEQGTGKPLQPVPASDELSQYPDLHVQNVQVNLGQQKGQSIDSVHISAQSPTPETVQLIPLDSSSDVGEQKCIVGKPSSRMGDTMDGNHALDLEEKSKVSEGTVGIARGDKGSSGVSETGQPQFSIGLDQSNAIGLDSQKLGLPLVWVTADNIDHPDCLKNAKGEVMTDNEIVQLIYPKTAEGLEDYSLDNDTEILYDDRQMSSDDKLMPIAYNTKRAYYPRVRQFIVWCEQRNIRPIPEGSRVAEFLQFRLENKVDGLYKKLTPSTFSSTLFALQDAFRKVCHAVGSKFGRAPTEHPALNEIKLNLNQSSRQERKIVTAAPHPDDVKIAELQVLLQTLEEKLSTTKVTLTTLIARSEERHKAVQLCRRNVANAKMAGSDTAIDDNRHSSPGSQNPVSQKESNSGEKAGFPNFPSLPATLERSAPSFIFPAASQPPTNTVASSTTSLPSTGTKATENGGLGNLSPEAIHALASLVVASLPKSKPGLVFNSTYGTSPASVFNATPTTFNSTPSTVDTKYNSTSATNFNSTHATSYNSTPTTFNSTYDSTPTTGQAGASNMTNFSQFPSSNLSQTLLINPYPRQSASNPATSSPSPLSGSSHLQGNPSFMSGGTVPQNQMQGQSSPYVMPGTVMVLSPLAGNSVNGPMYYQLSPAYQFPGPSPITSSPAPSLPQMPPQHGVTRSQPPLVYPPVLPPELTNQQTGNHNEIGSGEASEFEFRKRRREDSSEKFLVSSYDTVREIWHEFFVQGPGLKKPIIQLMALFGREGWHMNLLERKLGDINKKVTWQKRNWPVVAEILYKTKELGMTVSGAIKAVEKLRLDSPSESIDSLVKSLIGGVGKGGAIGAWALHKEKVSSILDNLIDATRDMCGYDKPKYSKKDPF